MVSGTGHDLEFSKDITQPVNPPVRASGGAGKLGHFYEAVVKGRAQILLAASVFHYRILSIKEVILFEKDRPPPYRLVSSVILIPSCNRVSICSLLNTIFHI
jgi:cyclase